MNKKQGGTLCPPCFFTLMFFNVAPSAWRQNGGKTDRTLAEIFPLFGAGKGALNVVSSHYHRLSQNVPLHGKMQIIEAKARF